MVPTLTAVLGVKGHRPEVGTRDDKDLLYSLGSVNVVDGRLHTSTLPCEVKPLRKAREAARKQGQKAPSKTGRLQQAFADHLEAVAKAYPKEEHPRVVLIIDNAPWHRGKLVTEVLKKHEHLELYRLPSYSPSLNVIERLWKALRRRATHNQLFENLAALTKAVRRGLRYFQTVRSRLMSLIDGCYPEVK